MEINGKKKTHFKGLLGELEFTLHLIKKGWDVFKPLDPNSRVDFVIEKDGKFRKIQIKYCTPYKGCLRVDLERPMRNTGVYSTNEIDDMGIYDAANKEFYLVPIKDILPRKEMWIRVGELNKKQEKNINWAEKYKI
jgi:hypothetical protein